jgi:hypothetical protein
VFDLDQHFLDVPRGELQKLGSRLDAAASIEWTRFFVQCGAALSVKESKMAEFANLLSEYRSAICYRQQKILEVLGSVPVDLLRLVLDYVGPVVAYRLRGTLMLYKHHVLEPTKFATPSISVISEPVDLKDKKDLDESEED